MNVIILWACENRDDNGLYWSSSSSLAPPSVTPWPRPLLAACLLIRQKICPSGWTACPFLFAALCPAARWRCVSGKTPTTKCAATAARPILSGRRSTCCWSSVRTVQVRAVHLTCPCLKEITVVKRNLSQDNVQRSFWVYHTAVRGRRSEVRGRRSEVRHTTMNCLSIGAVRML